MIEKVNVSELSFDKEPYIWKSPLAGLVVVSRPYYPDPRGSFQESFRRDALESAAGIEIGTIKQAAITEMVPKTIKGIHCERQFKLLQPLSGKYIFVEVDLRPDSSTFKQWQLIKIDANKGRKCAILVPNGFGNSMCILEPGKGSSFAMLHYSVTEEYDPQEAKRVVRYDDSDLAIPWPINDPIVSQRDLEGFSLKDFVKNA